MAHIWSVELCRCSYGVHDVIQSGRVEQFRKTRLRHCAQSYWVGVALYALAQTVIMLAEC